VHLIADGSLVASGPPETVLTAARIQAAYGAEVLVIEHPETGTPHLIPRRARTPADPVAARPADVPVRPAPPVPPAGSGN
jgi:iron complex transport system ATP-binding protein